MSVSVRYQFKQRLSASAKEAFDWCTTFTPDDNALMGEANAQREVIPIADGAILLKDTFHTTSGTVEKQKLVQLYPNIYTWTSTHLSGPNKHSQFLYQITPSGKTSTVTFTAHHLEPTQADAASLAEKLCKEDADAWKLLAKALKKEFLAHRQNLKV